MGKRNHRLIELLAPAKDVQCGKEAILHGADAVYIGASRFGARSAAGNSVADIAELCAFAHLYGARIYVTVNTILRDDELGEVERMIWQLYEAGVDALIVQDMGLTRLHLPPIPCMPAHRWTTAHPRKCAFCKRSASRKWSWPES